MCGGEAGRPICCRSVEQNSWMPGKEHKENIVIVILLTEIYVQDILKILTFQDPLLCPCFWSTDSATFCLLAPSYHSGEKEQGPRTHPLKMAIWRCNEKLSNTTIYICVCIYMYTYIQIYITIYMYKWPCPPTSQVTHIQRLKRK